MHDHSDNINFLSRADGTIRKSVGKRVGVYSTKKKTFIVPPKYDLVNHLCKQYYAVGKNESWGVYDSEKAIIIFPVKYLWVGLAFGNIIFVDDENLSRTYYDTEHNKPILSEYQLVDTIGDFNGDGSFQFLLRFWVVGQDSQYGVFDIETQQLVLPIQYKSIRSLQCLFEEYENVALLQTLHVESFDGCVNLYDLRSCSFIEGSTCSEIAYYGSCRSKEDDIYDESYTANDVILKQDTKRGICTITSYGYHVTPVVFDEITTSSVDCDLREIGMNYRVRIEENWGIYNTGKNELIVPIEYDAVGTLTDRYQWVENKGLVGVYDSVLKVIIVPLELRFN